MGVNIETRRREVATISRHLTPLQRTPSKQDHILRMCRQSSLAEALLVTLCILGVTSVQAEVSKRAPSGFMGMRGKKQDGGELVYEDMEKRAPGMGFQGMRGKKDQDNLVRDEPEYYDKRAPGMGFQGVRGKKDNDLGVFEDLDKRSPGMGFQGMRGKKDQNFMEDPGYYEKRAPSMGFQGMRGKKDTILDEYKRAPSMGFQGMRGKKDEEPSFVSEGDLTLGNTGMSLSHPSENNEEEEFTSEWDDIWGEGFDKRAPSGFFGMRGKKEPKAGFFGMRGKKAPSGFMGMRGKKAPSGFMGMRGKKADDMDLDLFLESLEADELRDEADAQLRRLEAIDAEAGVASDRTARQKRYRGPTNQKKAPSGFLGMRGKKWYARLESLGPQVANPL